MNYSLLLLLLVFMTPSVFSFSKKDKQELAELLNRPLNQMEKTIEELSQVAQQIQNVQINLPAHQEHNNQMHETIITKLNQVLLVLQQLIEEVIAQRLLLGFASDESVGEQEFNSVCDIDNAELSLISLLKSIYREQLSDKFIS